jgi:hypothetical protein
MPIKSIIDSFCTISETEGVVGLFSGPCKKQVIVVEMFKNNNLELTIATYQDALKNKSPLIKVEHINKTELKSYSSLTDFICQKNFFDKDTIIMGLSKKTIVCEQIKLEALCKDIDQDKSLLDVITRKKTESKDGLFLCQVITSEEKFASAEKSCFPIGYNSSLWAEEKLKTINLGRYFFSDINLDTSSLFTLFAPLYNRHEVNELLIRGCETGDCERIREMITHFPKSVHLGADENSNISKAGRYLNKFKLWKKFYPPLMTIIKDKPMPDAVALLLYFSKKLQQDVYEEAKTGIFKCIGPIAYLFNNYMMKGMYLNECDTIMFFLEKNCLEQYHKEVRTIYKTTYDAVIDQIDINNKELLQYLFKKNINFLQIIINDNNSDMEIIADAKNRLGWLYQNGFGHDPDSSTAYQLYSEAKDVNDFAKLNLALCYISGQGVEPSISDEKRKAEAEQLYLKFVKSTNNEPDLTLSPSYKETKDLYFKSLEKCNFFIKSIVTTFTEQYEKWENPEKKPNPLPGSNS